jgi:hypothetical protein
MANVSANNLVSRIVRITNVMICKAIRITAGIAEPAAAATRAAFLAFASSLISKLTLTTAGFAGANVS